jgi:tRNA1(Val) A37 N6-methylase TrmN6
MADRTDAFLGARLDLHQPACGHRAGTDAILLAAAVPAAATGLAIDAGAGTGAAGLAATLGVPRLRMALLEREAELAALARKNVEANRLDHCAFVAQADLLSRNSCDAAGLEREAADLVLTNPPYLSADAVRASPDAARASAHIIGAGGVAAWIIACLALLKPGGTFLIVHRADALTEILEALSPKAGAIVVLPIHSRADRRATRILLRALKGRRTPLVLAPPLVLHNFDGTFTASAEALHRGEARIDWDEISRV